MHNSPSQLVSLQTELPPARAQRSRVLLLRAPYFTPWTPPLGIAILKSSLNQNGHAATCFDFNADPELWGMHHKYFSILAAGSPSTSNDGYSKLWWIINAHMLSYANGATAGSQRMVIETISPLYGVRVNRSIVDSLLPLVEHYFARLSHLFDQIDLSAYDVVGASTYTTSLSSSLWLLRRAKQRSPGIKTVMGGGVFADDLALGSANLQTLLDEYPWVDHVVLGEGEMLFEQILDGRLAGKRVVSIGDLNGSTLNMKDVPLPDFSDFDLGRYYNLTIEGARSCPFQCSFCSETIQWGEYRKKPIDKFVDQVAELADRFNMREFFMGDSLMNPYLIPFADALTKRNVNVVYDGYLRADRPVTNQKFVKAWAESGLYRVRLGIESASERVLQAMDKKTTPAVIAEVLKTLARAGIRTTTYWIVGFPGETEEDFEQTCEFIRKNHQYIYELEAHPYYYYPYGQVGSRLYQCESVYPEEVTNLTKFKVWEIIGANPPREVRYHRLDRISALSASLGVPNIYTMSERYQAEERWRSLHPAALDVYKSDAVPVEIADSAAVSIIAGAKKGSLDGFLAYGLSVAKKLAPDLLHRSLTEILRHHKLLPAEQYPAYGPRVPAEPAQGSDLLHYFDPERGRSITESMAQELADHIGGNGSTPLRLGVLATPEEEKLLLVADRRFVDARSIKLLAEDLGRVYEQLASGRKPYLRLAEKTYSDYAAGLGANAKPTVTATLPAAESASLNLSLSAYSTGLSPLPDEGRNAVTRFLTASLRALAQIDIRDIAVFVDSRTFDRSLAPLVGPVARIIPWGDLQVTGDAAADCEQVTARLESLCLNPRPISGDKDRVYQVLINLECLMDTAWMGTEEWKSNGFFIESRRLPRTAGLQIVPLWTPEGPVVRVEYRREAVAETAAHKLVELLKEQVASVVGETDSMLRAQLFWTEELGSLRRFDGDAQTGHEAVPEAFEVIEIDLSGVTSGTDVPADTAYLRSALVAAHDLLLAKLEIPAAPQLLMLHQDKRELHPVPIRLLRTGNPDCQQFIQTARQKIAAAAEHSKCSRSIYRRTPVPGAVRHGCVLREDGLTRIDDLLNQNTPWLRPLITVLDVWQENAARARLFYRPGAVSREAIERLSESLPATLRRLLQQPQIRISDVIWDNNELAAFDTVTAVPELSHEFQF